MVHNVFSFRTTNVNLSLIHYGMEQDVFVCLAISSKIKYVYVLVLLLMVNAILAIASLIHAGLIISASVMRAIMKLMGNVQLLHLTLIPLLNHQHVMLLPILMISKKDVYHAQTVASHAGLAINAHSAAPSLTLIKQASSVSKYVVMVKDSLSAAMTEIISMVMAARRTVMLKADIIVLEDLPILRIHVLLLGLLL